MTENDVTPNEMISIAGDNIWRPRDTGYLDHPSSFHTHICNIIIHIQTLCPFTHIMCHLHQFLIPRMLLIFLFQSILSSSQGLKHKFVVKHDHRHFMGPIGNPFGFNVNGMFEFQVSNFEMQTSTTRKNGEQLEGLLYPGFLLKRFDSDQDFAKFKETILDNPNICGFQDFLEEDFEIPLSNDNNNDDDPYHYNVDDDHIITQGPGVIDGGSDGIFLSMSSWKTGDLKSNTSSSSSSSLPTTTSSLQHYFHAHEAGYYVLFYQICILDPQQAQKVLLFQHITSTFQLEFQHSNVDMFGKTSYLTAGEMVLPHLFLYFSMSYALLLFLWYYKLLNKNMHTNNKIYAIHHLMTIVLALKTASMFFESVRYHYIRIHGHAELWSFVYYFLNFIKGVFLFTVILLLGSGWSFFQPVLGKKQSRVIVFVFLLQIMNHISMAILTHETMGELWYNRWSNVLHILDIVSCGAILIPIVWQVQSLEETLEGQVLNNVVDTEKIEIQSKLTLLRSFYILVVAYIYYTRIVVYIVASTLTYKYTWIKDFITELGTLLFYVSVGMKFAPHVLQEIEYSQVKEDEEEETYNFHSNNHGHTTDSTIELSQIVVNG